MTITSQVYALTTTARVKDLLKITVTDHDTILTRLIADCTDFIENATNRRYKQTTYTNELYDGCYVDGTQKRTLVLNNAPLISISSLQYRTGAKSNPAWYDFQTDNYQEKLSTATIRGYMPAGIQNIRCSYVAGYLIDFTNEYDITAHTLPHDISGLCERLVMRRFKKRDSEGRSTDSFNGSGVTWSELLDDADKMTIADYQRNILV